MMKFLQFCAEYEEHPQQYEGRRGCAWKFLFIIVLLAFKDKSFGEFLTAQGLSPLLKKYVLHSITMLSGEVPTEQVG